MIKMGQKWSKEERYQKRLRSMLKRRKTSGKARKRLYLGYVELERWPLPKLQERADKVFSDFIRRRDRRCVLCGSLNVLQNGHLIKRAKKYVRWDEQNCNCLCSGCNKLDNYEHDHYVVWFIEKYGVKEYRKILEMSKIDVTSTWIRNKTIEVIKKYG